MTRSHALSSVLVLLALIAATACCARLPLPRPGGDNKVPVVVFNITVDETLWRPCVAWGLTPSLTPNTTTQQSVPIKNCDEGRFVYAYDDNFNHPVLKPTFYSSVIVDASPPTCVIACKPVDNQPMPYRCSQCSVMDSREGYHLTTYTFDVVGWKWRE